jgi:hypothetical protein
MAQTVSVIITTEDRRRLAAIIGERSRPLKHRRTQRRSKAFRWTKPAKDILAKIERLSLPSV